MIKTIRKHKINKREEYRLVEKIDYFNGIWYEIQKIYKYFENDKVIYEDVSIEKSMHENENWNYEGAIDTWNYFIREIEH